MAVRGRPVLTPDHVLDQANECLDELFESLGFQRSGAPTSAGEFPDRSVSGADAMDLLPLLAQLANRVAGAQAAVLNLTEETGAWRTEGVTLKSWMEHALILTESQASTELKTAMVTRVLPHLGAALREGSVTPATVEVIARVGCSRRQRAEDLPGYDETFTNLAKVASTSSVRKVMNAWADVVDPLTTASDERVAHDRRYLNLFDFADGVQLEAFVGKEQGALLKAALNGALSAQFQAEREIEAGEREPDCGVTDEGLEYETDAKPHRRVDAFIDGIIRPALEHGHLPSNGGNLPNVTVTVPFERLKRWHQDPDTHPDLSTLLPGDGNSGALPYLQDGIWIGPNNGPGETTLSELAARALSCDCRLTVMVLGDHGVPMSIGRSNRVIPKHMREALVQRDRGCIHPGCDKPPGWTDAHHIQHWADGGPTELQNLALLCRKHHTELHAEGHHITMINGRPEVTTKWKAPLARC